jgi:hypothetical protein
MLYLDLNEPDDALSHELKSLCEGYGTVEAVMIERSPATRAIVGMKTHIAAVRVRGNLGDCLIDRFITIRLSQRNLVAQAALFA